MTGRKSNFTWLLREFYRKMVQLTKMVINNTESPIKIQNAGLKQGNDVYSVVEAIETISSLDYQDVLPQTISVHRSRAPILKSVSVPGNLWVFSPVLLFLRIPFKHVASPLWLLKFGDLRSVKYLAKLMVYYLFRTSFAEVCVRVHVSHP